MRVTSYVHFDGQCRAAFEFYAGLLGTRVGMAMSYADSPVPVHLPEADKSRMMHMAMAIGDSTLMGSDAPPGMFEGNRGFSLSLDPAEPAEAERLFAALSEGGTVRMPIQETFWAHRFAMLTDKFGIPWMISCDKPMG